MSDAYDLDTAQRWRNRIVGAGEVDPEELLANPFNHRIHGKNQQDVMAGVLDEVGWVQDVVVNQQTGHIVDGHLRVTLALRKGEPAIPVKWVDLTEEEEHLILLTLDWVTGLAQIDRTQVDLLLHDIQTADEHLQEALAQIAADAGLYGDGQEVDFDEFDDVSAHDVMYRVVIDGLTLEEANIKASEVGGIVEQYREKILA